MWCGSCLAFRWIWFQATNGPKEYHRPFHVWWDLRRISSTLGLRCWTPLCCDGAPLPFSQDFLSLVRLENFKLQSANGITFYLHLRCHPSSIPLFLVLRLMMSSLPDSHQVILSSFPALKDIANICCGFYYLMIRSSYESSVDYS